ncbi:MAG: dihydroorotate dehydrogenase-like protein [Odoribacter sp.]|nr:dihydroorotate dehydrogenase-like protein [Odoribacter sp.]
MENLKTQFIGLDLQSPIIAGSCGLTSDINKLEELARYGVGAVILKSIFEEQINRETSHTLSDDNYPEEADYIQNYVRANTIQQYIDLVKQAKARLNIPVIASISCLQDGEWGSFARELKQAGADALELNIFILPTDEFVESAVVEHRYFEVVKHVKKEVNMPLIVKICRNFTTLTAFVSKLKAYGADAVTIFNRFYEPEIDIEKMTVGSTVLSQPGALRSTLRWTGILAGKYKQMQFSATSGVHSGEDVVKLLLAGATTVQVCSALYEDGLEMVQTMNRFLSDWMERKGFHDISEFRGKLSYADVNHADRYERAQFMKYFSNRK